MLLAVLFPAPHKAEALIEGLEMRLSLSPTTKSLTSPCSTSSQHEESGSRSPELFSPTPQVAQPRTKGHLPLPSLNDPHTSGEGTSYTTMPVSPQPMGATMCVAVLALSHPTPQLLFGMLTIIRSIYTQSSRCFLVPQPHLLHFKKQINKMGVIFGDITLL